MLPFLGPKAPAAAIAPHETRPVRSGALPNAAMMPNGRTGATPRRVVEVEAAAMLSIPTTGVGIGAEGREAAAMVSMPAMGACIGTAGRESIAMDGEPSIKRPWVF